MARTTLAVQDIVRTGLEAAYTAANADGQKAALSRGMFFHVKNGSAGDVTITIPTPNTVDGLAITDRTVVVTAAEERFIGPFPAEHYQQSDGMVYIDYSAAADVTVAALRVP